MATIAYYILSGLIVVVAILLVLVILIEKGRGGGLSSSFGGGGGSSAFGAKTGDVLTWATSIIFGVFILLGVTLDLTVDHMYPSAAQTSSTPATPLPVKPAAPAASPPAPAPPVTPPVTPTQPAMPTMSLPTTQPITNTGNQLIQAGKNAAKGVMNPASQPAAPLLNHK